MDGIWGEGKHYTGPSPLMAVGPMLVTSSDLGCLLSEPGRMKSLKEGQYPTSAESGSTSVSSPAPSSSMCHCHTYRHVAR